VNHLQRNECRTSVVVPSYNGAHRLLELLPKLARQDFKGRWEVIFCLDGSDDNSQQLLTGWESRLPMRVINSQRRRGVALTLNEGFNAANGSVLIRCDDDLTPRSDFVTRHTQWHQDRQDLGVIGLTRDYFPDSRYARAYGRRASERAFLAAQRTAANQRWVHWAANNSIHRDTWAMSGGFDPRFLYGQDSEFGFRLTQLGVEIVIDLELTADHRGPATSVERRARRAYVSGASRRMREQLHRTAVQPVPDAADSYGLNIRVWNSASRVVRKYLTSIDTSQKMGRQLDLALPFMPQL
jgi:glycosyltransferase involved in cell wall biosynthesis